MVGTDIENSLCLNTEWAIGIWHSWLKHFNFWRKAAKNLICYSCIFIVQLHVDLKKWTVKFKLLYLRNYITYFNKIRSVCCMNTRIQSLKVWLKSILSRLKYSIFSRGLFFIGAPCRPPSSTCSDGAFEDNCGWLFYLASCTEAVKTTHEKHWH